jgi:hypothetical protein
MAKAPPNEVELFMLISKWISENAAGEQNLLKALNAYVSAVGMSTKAMVSIVAATRPDKVSDQELYEMTVEFCTMIEQFALKTKATISDGDE